MEVDFHNIETAIFDGREGIESLTATAPDQLKESCVGKYAFFYLGKYRCPSGKECSAKLCHSPATINDHEIYECNLEW